MATVKLDLDMPSQDAAWLQSLAKGTELVIVKERGTDSGLIPQAVLVAMEVEGD